MFLISNHIISGISSDQAIQVDKPKLKSPVLNFWYLLVDYVQRPIK